MSKTNLSIPSLAKSSVTSSLSLSVCLRTCLCNAVEEACRDLWCTEWSNTVQKEREFCFRGNSPAQTHPKLIPSRTSRTSLRMNNNSHAALLFLDTHLTAFLESICKIKFPIGVSLIPWLPYGLWNIIFLLFHFLATHQSLLILVYL